MRKAGSIAVFSTTRIWPTGRPRAAGDQHLVFRSDSLTAEIVTTTPGDADPFSGRTVPGKTHRDTITVKITELQLLVRAVMRYSPFTVSTTQSTQLILQKDGVIMGVNLAPSLADVVAAEAKLKLVDAQILQDTHGRDSPQLRLRCARLQAACPTPFESVQELKHTLRQIDDVAMVATPSFLAQRGKEWITHFYKGPALGLNLVWTDPEAGDWIPWLDTRQRINPDTGELEQRMYSKPGNTFTYPHGEGCVPPGQRKGILLGGLKRIQIICSPADIPSETAAFLARLQNLQYDAADMRQWIRQAISGQETAERRSADTDAVLANALQQLSLSDGRNHAGTPRQRRAVLTYHPNIPAAAVNAALRERDEQAGGIAWRALPGIAGQLPRPRAPAGAKRSRARLSDRSGRLRAEAIERKLIAPPRRATQRSDQ